MLKVEGLHCRYGKVSAVRNLSLEVDQGELVTLIGANGAGKTSTLKAISGILPPADGKINLKPLVPGGPLAGLGQAPGS